MMTSDQPDEAYVWIWLPGATEPIVAGRISSRNGAVEFRYGQSYLARAEAIPLYLPELPLERGPIRPLGHLTIAGCIADAGPDAWGRRVVMYRRASAGAADFDPESLSPITYLLETGSDRIGALDFQASATDYDPRGGSAQLSELAEAAQRLEAGIPFSAPLDEALLHGSSVGGARPKALLRHGDRAMIAKFSSSTDAPPGLAVKREYAAMTLAWLAGLNVARVELTSALGKDVLLVERFDRIPGGGGRRNVVSVLTLLGLDEVEGWYATYWELADIIRQRFINPVETLRELFSRIAFNIAIGNTDDHARNHAAFWNGEELELTPAYDIDPQPRSGGEAKQALAFGREGQRLSRFADVISCAPTYLLTVDQGRGIVERIIDTIDQNWRSVAEQAGMTRLEQSMLWKRAILNPFAFQPSE
jgi:serine/threonine-protein kinase HipA